MNQQYLIVSAVKHSIPLPKNNAPSHFSESDISMASILTSLSSKTLVERVISTINAELPSNIMTPSSVMKTIHHPVTPQFLVSKWNIDLIGPRRP